MSKKFDVIVANPPYQDPKNKRSPLWQKFVKKSLDLLEDNGHMAMIHPSAWRKPEHELFKVFQKNNLKYLEMHDQKDGLTTFGAGTRYDWYVLENKANQGKTIIIDEIGYKGTYDVSTLNCIPHRDLEWFISLVAKPNEKRCEILHSRSAYGNDKKHMSKAKDLNFKYPCVHATKSGGPEYLYSSTKTNGHFGVSKIILGKGSPENGFFDKGNYGITNNCFGICVESDEDGKFLEEKLKSDKFAKLISLFKWAGFAVDNRAFGYLKYGFWKEFI